MSDLLPVVQERTCGSCQACCTVFGITELEKPPYSACTHLREHGCGIYERRPLDCQDYLCGWRLGGGGAFDRPDLVGVLLTQRNHRPGVVAGLPEFSLTAHEVWPQACQEPGAIELLQCAAATGYLVFIILFGRDDCSMVLGPVSLVREAKRYCNGNYRLLFQESLI